MFRDCAVDTKAKLVPSPRFEFPLTRGPTSGGTCYRDEVAFVVNPDGSAEAAGARVVNSNDTEFGEAVLNGYAH